MTILRLGRFRMQQGECHSVRAWVVRGDKGRFEKPALSEGVVILGWDEISDLSKVASPEEVRTALQHAHPAESPYRIGNWTGQLWRFRNEISIGDLVVLPRVGGGLAIGRVTGSYEWRAVGDLPPAHLRTVHWLRTDVPRTEAEPDLRDSLGSLLTVFELRRNDAAQRIDALSQGLADPGAPSTEQASTVFGSTEELLEAAAARDNSDPIVLPIRSLLGLWGAHRRGPAIVEQIQKDLAETGLTTQPPFTDGDINGSVAIIPTGVDPDAVEPEQAAEQAALALPPVSFLVGNLPTATAGVVAAEADEPLVAAVSRMQECNYSQLPVLFADKTLRGAVTWRSIASTVPTAVAPLRVIDAVANAPTALSTDSLLDTAAMIGYHGYVVVVDESMRVKGIVTSADLSGQFAVRVKPFILAEEVEQRLRRIVDGALARKKITIAMVCDALGDKKEKIQAAKDLTLGQYRPVFEVQAVWEGIGLKYSHALFLAQLNAVKEFRNNLMHFSPDPIAPTELVTVESFINLLQALEPTA